MIRPPLRRIAAALALAAAAACAGALPPAPAPTNPVRFVSINDVYVADTLPDGSGGLARVAAIRDRIALEGPTLFVLAGDVLSPEHAQPAVLRQEHGGRAQRGPARLRHLRRARLRAPRATRCSRASPSRGSSGCR